jgi:hypothetical protein
VRVRRQKKVKVNGNHIPELKKKHGQRGTGWRGRNCFQQRLYKLLSREEFRDKRGFG